MNAMNRGFRLLTLVLIATLAIGFATPGRAEAIEPLTIVAIAGLAVIVIVVVVYLIVANMNESKSRNVQGEPRYLACIESDVEPRNCWAIPEPSGHVPAVAAPPAAIAAATQGP
jgi:hypothetical protein